MEFWKGEDIVRVFKLLPEFACWCVACWQVHPSGNLVSKLAYVYLLE